MMPLNSGQWRGRCNPVTAYRVRTWHRRMRSLSPGRRPGLGALAVLALVAGCNRGHTRPPTSTIASTATVVTAGPVPSPFQVASLSCTAGHANPVTVRALFEVEGRATVGSLWALVFADHPFAAVHQVKIAWHMTGTGPLHLSASNLDTGQVVAPWNGPEPHSSSSWHRPGDEWGTVWVFPAAGCWRITAARSNTSGSITMTVIGPPE